MFAMLNLTAAIVDDIVAVVAFAVDVVVAVADVDAVAVVDAVVDEHYC